MFLKRINRPFGYERVYLPLYKAADTPFHIQGDDMCLTRQPHMTGVCLGRYIAHVFVKTELGLRLPPGHVYIWWYYRSPHDLAVLYSDPDLDFHPDAAGFEPPPGILTAIFSRNIGYSGWGVKAFSIPAVAVWLLKDPHFFRHLKLELMTRHPVSSG